MYETHDSTNRMSAVVCRDETIVLRATNHKSKIASIWRRITRGGEIENKISWHCHLSALHSAPPLTNLVIRPPFENMKPSTSAFASQVSRMIASLEALH